MSLYKLCVPAGSSDRPVETHWDSRDVEPLHLGRFPVHKLCWPCIHLCIFSYWCLHYIVPLELIFSLHIFVQCLFTWMLSCLFHITSTNKVVNFIAVSVLLILNQLLYPTALLLNLCMKHTCLLRAVLCYLSPKLRCRRTPGSCQPQECSSPQSASTQPPCVKTHKFSHAQAVIGMTDFMQIWQ